MSDHIRVGIIMDGEDDAEFEYTEHLVTDSIPGASVVYKAHDAQGLKQVRCDLMILDYGGIAAYGCWDIATYNIRAVIEWAENHPSSAILLWTEFTTRVYKYEVEEQFGHLPNMFLCAGDCQAEMLEQAARWLGFPGSEGG